MVRKHDDASFSGLSVFKANTNEVDLIPFTFFRESGYSCYNPEAGDFIVLHAGLLVDRFKLCFDFIAKMAACHRVGIFLTETRPLKLAERFIELPDLVKRDIQEYVTMIDAVGMGLDDIRAFALEREYDFLVIETTQRLDGPGGPVRVRSAKNHNALLGMARSLGVTVFAV